MMMLLLVICAAMWFSVAFAASTLPTSRVVELQSVAVLPDTWIESGATTVASTLANRMDVSLRLRNATGAVVEAGLAIEHDGVRQFCRVPGDIRRTFVSLPVNFAPSRLYGTNAQILFVRVGRHGVQAVASFKLDGQDTFTRFPLCLKVDHFLQQDPRAHVSFVTHGPRPLMQSHYNFHQINVVRRPNGSTRAQELAFAHDITAAGTAGRIFPDGAHRSYTHGFKGLSHPVPPHV
ncbi:hypothetical protein RI367_008398 [Sorochytrium milnesiophthora]